MTGKSVPPSLPCPPEEPGSVDRFISHKTVMFPHSYEAVTMKGQGNTGESVRRVDIDRPLAHRLLAPSRPFFVTHIGRPWLLLSEINRVYRQVPRSGQSYYSFDSITSHCNDSYVGKSSVSNPVTSTFSYPFTSRDDLCPKSARFLSSRKLLTWDKQYMKLIRASWYVQVGAYRLR